LNSLQDSTAVAFPELSAHTGMRITDIRSFHGDTLVLATVGKGVLLVKDGQFLAGMREEGQDGQGTIRRVYVARDTIWTAGTQGVNGYILRDHELVRVARLGRLEGLPATDANDVLVTQDRILVATSEGLCVLPLYHRPPSEARPSIYFSSITLDDSVVTGASALSWREGRGRLGLVLRAITFMDQDRVAFQYRLTPDAPWAPMNSGRLDLASLAAGTYRFEARARKDEGRWSVPLLLDLTVVPPWYAGPWALFALWMGAALLLLYAAAWSLRRQYARQLKRLAELNMLNEERRRIAADVHDDLGADLSHLLIRAQNALEEDNKDDGRLALGALSKGLRGTMEKIDEIIWSLDPGRDNLRATADFIEGWVRNYTHAHGIGFRSEIVGLLPELSVHAVQRRELALVVKEAVRNIVRHANARTLQLGIAVAQRQLRITIEDDGTSSPVGATSGNRSGLSNMQRRLDRLGARSRYALREPQGTELVIELRLDDGASPDVMMPGGSGNASLQA
jgi:signal transduction histidine kinase